MTDKKQLDLIPQQGECVVGKFLKKDVRKTFYNGEWWFSIIDIIEGLAETPEPASYWNKVKQNDDELRREWTKLKMPSKDGKYRDTEVANVEEILRIVQSVPSKNAEPFKKWLAKTGFERLQEQNNPDLTVKRAILYYELQGRDKQWIQNRIDGQFTRNELTGEWKQRGVKEGQEYATLTNIISQETFGVSVSKHKEIKSLKKENLRDHMTNIELIFQRLGEEATIEVTRQRNTKGFEQNKKAAKDGGASAGEARKAYENKIGNKVVTSDNFLKKVEEDKINLLEENKNFEPAIDKIANTIKIKA
ncbi:Bro-N domain-containing phage-related protein [Candidatus Cyrtobacter comes]|uniref:Bro-N domain-containing phage-related protein n=1 Tax=Candidatus Cyrtobacter comes TaxID=675776 RepID=A0ABU5L9F6_9RICK|nr:Bro-N domain-containing protein [Candidatus Cyrtobacter comes]MDZ5762762.1 Bro-N domain-containing phage-related protein [Candidatus Cyrtobacter comes]